MPNALTNQPHQQRSAGRLPDQLRSVEIIADYTRYAEGSALIRLGDTHVLCNASVLERVPPFLQGRGQGWVTAEYGMLPRATHTRGEREAAKGKQSGRTQEIQRLIGRSLRAVFDLQALGERSLHIDCDVIQADGGTRCASITGAWVAAAIAVRGLQKQGLDAAQVLTGQVAAVSVGMLADRALLDLDYAEDVRCDTDMNVVMTNAHKYVEIQGTAEGQGFERSQLNTMLDLAQAGISSLFSAQLNALHSSQK